MPYLLFYYYYYILSQKCWFTILYTFQVNSLKISVYKLYIAHHQKFDFDPSLIGLFCPIYTFHPCLEPLIFSYTTLSYRVCFAFYLLYEWNHSVFSLIYFYKHNLFQLHSSCCKWQDFIVFNSEIVFHCISIPHPLYLLYCQWAFD